MGTLLSKTQSVPVNATQLNLDKLLVQAVKRFEWKQAIKFINIGANPQTNVDNIPILLHYVMALINQENTIRFSKIMEQSNNEKKVLNLLLNNINKNTTLNVPLYLNLTFELAKFMGPQLSKAKINTRGNIMNSTKLSGTLEYVVVQIYSKMNSENLIDVIVNEKILEIVTAIRNLPDFIEVESNNIIENILDNVTKSIPVIANAEVVQGDNVDNVYYAQAECINK